MATTQRPSAVARVEPAAQQVSILERPELAVLTTREARAFLEPRLKGGIKFEEVLSEILAVILSNSKLAECKPASLLNAVAKALSTGLRIGEKIFIVPFGNEATTVRSYQGDIELIVAAGGAKAISAHAVYEGDRFEYELGSSAFVRHVPLLKSLKDRKIVAGYAVAQIAGVALPKIVVMGVDEIDEIRRLHSKSWYQEWVQDGGKRVQRIIPIERIPWYVEKTPVHRIAKQLPTNPRLAAVVKQLEEEIVTDAEFEIEGQGEKGAAPAIEVRSAAPLSTTAGARAAASSPAPAADTDGVSTDIVDAANDLKVPGGPNHFNGMGGKPIGTVDTPNLRRIRKWAADGIAQAGFKPDDPGADPVKVDTLRAIDIVLTHRQDQEEAAAPTPAGPVSMPPGGKVADTVKPTTPLPMAKPAGPGLTELAAQAKMLLDASTRPAAELAELRKQYDAASSSADLQSLINDLSFPV